MNKKGQALVEFILILPIMIFLLLAIIDISRLMIMKNHLETLLSEVNINTTQVIDSEYEIKFTTKDLGEELLVQLESCLDLTTPGLDKILKNTCAKTSKRIKKVEENYEKN